MGQPPRQREVALHLILQICLFNDTWPDLLLSQTGVAAGPQCQFNQVSAKDGNWPSLQTKACDC